MMKIARLNVRWMGRQAGALVYGQEADHALAAGIAVEQDPPRRRKIRTGPQEPLTATPPPSSIHETPPEENTSDEPTGDPEPDGD